MVGNILEPEICSFVGPMLAPYIEMSYIYKYIRISLFNEMSLYIGMSPYTLQKATW